MTTKIPSNVLERDEKGRITKTTGRKPKFSDQDIATLGKRIAEFVRAGSYLTPAARASGLDPNTFWYFYKKGKSGHPRFAEFYDTVERAEAESEIFAVAMIRKAIQEGNWVAGMTFLERKWPDRWGRRDSVHVEGGVDVNVQQKQPVLNIIVSQEAKRQAEEASSQPIVDAQVVEEKIYHR